MTIEEFIAEYCYEGQDLRITGIGTEAETFYEGTYHDIEDIPEDILDSILSQVWAAEDSVLVLECDYDGEE